MRSPIWGFLQKLHARYAAVNDGHVAGTSAFAPGDKQPTSGRHIFSSNATAYPEGGGGYGNAQKTGGWNQAPVLRMSQ